MEAEGGELGEWGKEDRARGGGIGFGGGEEGWVGRSRGLRGHRAQEWFGFCRGLCNREVLEAQQAQGHSGVCGHVAAGCGDVLGTSEAKQADGEVAKRCEHLSTMALSHLRSVLVEGDVAHPVEAVFDRPLSSCEGQELGG